MKENRYFIHVLLTATVGIVCLTGIITRAFCPGMIFPQVNIPFLVLLSLIPLVMEYYLVSDIKRNWLISAFFVGVIFVVLPFCAGWNTGVAAWKLFASGIAVFGVTDGLYRSVGERMSLYSRRGFSPIANAFVLYLASQCLQGLL